MACQIGSPTQTGSGAVLANWYQMFSPVDYPYLWSLAYGTAQPPGPGTSNRFATIQGGQPADGHDHNQGGQSAYMQGFVDWFDASSPAPIQPTYRSPTRRWFAGLGRPLVRLGR